MFLISLNWKLIVVLNFTQACKCFWEADRKLGHKRQEPYRLCPKASC